MWDWHYIVFSVGKIWGQRENWFLEYFTIASLLVRGCTCPDYHRTCTAQLWNGPLFKIPWLNVKTFQLNAWTAILVLLMHICSSLHLLHPKLVHHWNLLSHSHWIYTRFLVLTTNNRHSVKNGKQFSHFRKCSSETVISWNDWITLGLSWNHWFHVHNVTFTCT